MTGAQSTSLRPKNPAMHRVHHFWTSSDALNASLAEGEVREGDVLVVVGERVVGLASTDPIAITVNAGALRAFHLSADRRRRPRAA